MKIHSYSKNLQGDLVRVSAAVIWEDCDRPQREIYIETTSRFGTDLNCNPNAFLLASVIPAWYHGERRVQVDGTICSQLHDGINTAIQILTNWYGIRSKNSLTIEATQGFNPTLPSPEHVASFMSGGVDALATLRTNRLYFPLDHPFSIKDCLHVHGIDIGGYENLKKNKENFALSVASLEKFAECVNVKIIPVYMNLRYLDDSDAIFSAMSHGAIIASIAHGFSHRITKALIPSTYTIDELGPWGSHPLLDFNYSSVDVTIRHDGLRYSRLEKVGLIADWSDALQTLRSCYYPFRPEGTLNCGKCEKCLRTMVELLVHGKLSQCQTFPLNEITADIIRSLKVSYPSQIGPDDFEDLSLFKTITHGSIHYWRQMIDPLSKIGRFDLADAIQYKVEEYDQVQSRIRLKNKVKRIDNKYLGGILTMLNQIRKRYL